jgi:uncharacterized protein YjbI with pentapeptide repeats
VLWTSSIIRLKEIGFRSGTRGEEVRDLRYRDLPEADLSLRVAFALVSGLVILCGLIFAEKTLTWIHPSFARQAKPAELFQGAMALREVMLKVGIGIGGLWTLVVALRKMETGKQEARIKIQDSDLKREEAVHDRFLRSVELVSNTTAHLGRMGGAIECAQIGAERRDLRPQIIVLFTELLRAEIAAYEAFQAEKMATKTDLDEERKEALRRGAQATDEGPAKRLRRDQSPQLSALARLAFRASTGLHCLEGSTPRMALNLRDLDLTGVEFRKADVSNLDFGGMVLSGARIEGVRFSQVRGSEANFVNANLASSEWQDADLTKALFEKAEAAGAIFRGNLTGSKWPRANMPGSIFDDCKLADATFEGATLTKARFERAVLKNADYRKSSLGACRR